MGWTTQVLTASVIYCLCDLRGLFTPLTLSFPACKLTTSKAWLVLELTTFGS